jgi:hypothetical protein
MKAEEGTQTHACHSKLMMGRTCMHAAVTTNLSKRGTRMDTDEETHAHACRSQKGPKPMSRVHPSSGSPSYKPPTPQETRLPALLMGIVGGGERHRQLPDLPLTGLWTALRVHRLHPASCDLHKQLLYGLNRLCMKEVHVHSGQVMGRDAHWPEGLVIANT